MSKPDGKLRSWRKVAQELAEERDPDKVTALAKELTEALDAQGPRLDLHPRNLTDDHLPAEDHSPKKV